MEDARKGGLDRRRLLSMGGTAIAGASLAAPASPAASKPQGAQQATSKTDYAAIHEGTNIAIAVSPDEKTVVFDLFGILWRLPIEGGQAAPLTDVYADAAMPGFTPDGGALVFQSYRDGNFHVWMVNLDGSGLKQLTHGAFDCREPMISPEGGRVAYASDRGGAYGVHVLDLASGKATPWSRVSGQACQPAWSPDGRWLAYAVDRTHIVVTDAEGGSPGLATPAIRGSTDLMNPAQLQSPAFTRDGKALVCHVQENGRTELRTATGPLFAGEDVFPFRPVWLKGGDMLYTADGKIKRRSPTGAVSTIEFVATVPVTRPVYPKIRRDYDSTAPKPVTGIGSPALSPDGTSVAFRALNALYVMPLGGKPVAVVSDSYWKCDPAWSPDGKTLAYSTDRSGKLEIWLRDMASGGERQLTHHTDAALSAAWSKDGAQIAFLDQTGALHRVEVASGTITKVFSALWEPGKPSWSADGRTIAYAAFKPYSPRYREGLSEILTVDVASGTATYQPVFPDRSLGVRGDDGPVWTADGRRMAFVFASRLHVVEVAQDGKFLGAPKALNEEVTDAPTWSGDGSRLLYLSNGKLRLIDAAGGPPRTVPVPLTWANAKPKDRLVVRAGRLWEGKGPELRTNVDVVVEGNRIAGLLPAGQAAVGDAKLIDATDATVIPGLVEMHAHRQMQGYGYGDREGRLWLSLGVTTTRSPGSPAYHMVEDRESLDAGLRVGPRYFATGEAIDGSRIFYNFMRPVTEPGQMELELSRAKALGYDLIKCYVRLPLAAQRDVIAWAHEQGMHVSGHYHYPAIWFGIDGMEHMGATSRLGYSRTVSLGGASYQDVTAVFVTSGARRTPTLFQASALLDRALVDDARIKALYPPWEYAKLDARARAVAGGDNELMLTALKRSVDHLKAIIRNGGRVVTGTDSPIDLNAVSLHLNLRAMTAYGMTPYEALTTATRFPAEFLEQPIGMIAPGMLADMVITEGNPLADIRDAAAVRITIKNGLAFDIPTLLAPFEGKPKTAHVALLQPAEGPPASDHWWHAADYVEASRTACCADPMCRPARGARRIFMAEEV